MYCFKSALIVDDQKTTAMVISEVLRRLGFADVAAAGDGAEALSMLEQRRYDLIISDLHMGGMDGLELLREVRSDGRLSSVPFIMISVDARSDELARVRDAGADAFLAKPFGAPALRQKMSLVCESRGGDCSRPGGLGAQDLLRLASAQQNGGGGPSALAPVVASDAGLRSSSRKQDSRSGPVRQLLLYQDRPA